MSGKKKNGGVGDFFGAIVAAAVFFGIFIANGSTDLTDFFNIARNKSSQVNECINEQDCDIDTKFDLSNSGKKIDLSGLGKKIDMPKLGEGQYTPPSLGGEKHKTPNLEGKELGKILGQSSLSVKDKLNGLIIDEGKKTKYDRNEWKHWKSAGRSCWNVREEVLDRDSQEITYLNKSKNETSNKNEACYVVKGVWIDPYSGKEIKDPKKIDIDHVIPLGYVARHGGAEWSKEEKEKYANDPEVLLAVSASENRSKSDKGPADYMPPNTDFHCSYAKIFTSVADKYTISISAQDKKALNDALRTCSD